MTLSDEHKNYLQNIMDEPVRNLVAMAFGITLAFDWLEENPAYAPAVGPFFDKIDEGASLYLGSSE